MIRNYLHPGWFVLVDRRRVAQRRRAVEKYNAEMSRAVFNLKAGAYLSERDLTLLVTGGHISRGERREYEVYGSIRSQGWGLG